MSFILGQENPVKQTCKSALFKIGLNHPDLDVALEWLYQLLFCLLN